MSVLFIGGVFAEENQKEIIENTKGYAEFSANIFLFYLTFFLFRCIII